MSIDSLLIHMVLWLYKLKVHNDEHSGRKNYLDYLPRSIFEYALSEIAYKCGATSVRFLPRYISTTFNV